MASTIILSDNGASSGSAGLKQTAGNDGVLILQTTTSGGTATNAIYVDTSQNVALGTTPSAWDTGHSVKAFQIGTSGVGSLWTYNNYAAFLGCGYYWNGTNRLYLTTGNAVSEYSQNSGVHTWYSAASGTAGNAISLTQVLAVDKDKSLALQGATSATGTGITFPATQSASSDVNTLDDYEEGTFTVTLTGSTSGAPGTYGTRNAYYTKIGRMVYVTLQVVGFSKGTLIGNLIVGGLPFTIQNSANATGTLRYELPSPTAGTTVILPQGADGTTYLDIQLFTNAAFNGGYNTSGLSASATNNIYNLVYIYQTST